MLILTGRIKITPGHTDVSSTHLTDLLGTYLLELHKNSQLTDGEKANLEQNLQDTVAIFPKLQTGLDVNVKFSRYVVCVCGGGSHKLVPIPATKLQSMSDCEKKKKTISVNISIHAEVPFALYTIKAM